MVTSSTIATSFSIAKPSLSSTSSTSTITTSVKTPTTPLVSPQPVVKLVKLPPAPSVSSTSDAVSNQEQIVEKAKQVNDDNAVYTNGYIIQLRFLSLGSLCYAKDNGVTTGWVVVRT